MFKHKKKKEKKRVKKAFTFIEVMIVVTIIGIMTSVVLTFIGQSKHNTELETAANEIVASIRKIQNYSLSGKNVTPGCASYRLTTISGTGNFVVDNGGATCPISESYKLKNSVIFNSNSVVEFNAPFANRSTSNTIDIIITKSGNDYHICVTGVGVITMQSSAC